MPGLGDPKDKRHTEDTPEVRARLEEALGLAQAVARQLKPLLSSWIPAEDLIGYANEGALGATRTFEEARGVPFRRWASIKIRGAVLDGVRRQSDIPRRFHERLRSIEAANNVEDALLEEDAAGPPSSPEAADARLNDYLAAMATALAAGTLLVRDESALEAVEDEADTPDVALDRARLRAKVRAAIAERPDAERRLLELYWFEDKTLDESAAQLGLSKSWASRLHARALQGITDTLRNRPRR